MPKPRKKFKLPTRALFAEAADGRRATSTWAKRNGVWYSHSASKHLKWMVGMENFEVVKQQLMARGFKWSWIESSESKTLKPPFL